MKKVFQADYKEHMARPIERYLMENLPSFTGNGDTVIVEIIYADGSEETIEIERNK